MLQLESQHWNVGANCDGTFSFSIGTSLNALPIKLQTIILVTTAKSVKAFRKVWLGRKGLNLNFRNKKASIVVPRNTITDKNADAQ